MKIIGLLITKNEEDIIEEVLDNHCKFCDHILALDGSSDRTGEIIKDCNKVIHFSRDPKGVKIRDGIRGLLLDRVIENFDCVHEPVYCVVLHGDEIWYSDPRWFLKQAMIQGATKVLSLAPMFYLSKEQCFWEVPKEYRAFRVFTDSKYKLDQHQNVLPSLQYDKQLDFIPIVKHFSYRSIEQMKTRALDRNAREWQDQYKLIKPGVPDSFFYEHVPFYSYAEPQLVSFEESVGRYFNPKDKLL